MDERTGRVKFLSGFARVLHSGSRSRFSSFCSRGPNCSVPTPPGERGRGDIEIPGRRGPRGVRHAHTRSSGIIGVRAATRLRIILIGPREFRRTTTVNSGLGRGHAIILGLRSAGESVTHHLLSFLDNITCTGGNRVGEITGDACVVAPCGISIVNSLVSRLRGGNVVVC